MSNPNSVVVVRDSFSRRGKGSTHLDGTVDVAAGVLEDVLERLAAGLGLVGDAAADEVALGVGRDLAGDPDLAGGFDSLGLWVLVRDAIGSSGVMFARDDGYDSSRRGLT